MSLDAKLSALSKSPETVTLKDLTGHPEALIVGARRVTTRFGRVAVVLDIQGEDIISSVFLPGRYGEVLEDADLEKLVQDKYKLKVVDGETSIPNVILFQ